MRLSHSLGRMSVAFDDPNLVSAGGLLPVVALADAAGLRDLADEHLTVPTDKGANAGVEGRFAGSGDGCGRGQHR